MNSRHFYYIHYNFSENKDKNFSFGMKVGAQAHVRTKTPVGESYQICLLDIFISTKLFGIYIKLLNKL